MKYNHGEAFCLMVYQCVGRVDPNQTFRNANGGGPLRLAGCGHKETFWNSRDGVTPFCTSCPSCGGDLQHINWKMDVCTPDHTPRYGQGIWRDGTPDEAEAFMRKRLASYSIDHLTPEYVEKLIATVRNPDDTGNTEFRKGWPMLDRHGYTPTL